MIYSIIPYLNYPEFIFEKVRATQPLAGWLARFGPWCGYGHWLATPCFRPRTSDLRRPEVKQVPGFFHNLLPVWIYRAHSSCAPRHFLRSHHVQAVQTLLPFRGCLDCSRWSCQLRICDGSAQSASLLGSGCGTPSCHRRWRALPQFFGKQI